MGRCDSCQEVSQFSGMCERCEKFGSVDGEVRWSWGRCKGVWEGATIIRNCDSPQ